MSLVNTETGELIEVSYADVKSSVEKAKASLEEAAEQIVWQIENQAWIVLGYSDWNEMREAEYGGAAFMVPRHDRPELTARMRRAGLSTPEIAATAGVSDDTVRRDLQTANAVSEPITNARGQSRPATYAKPDRRPQLPPVVALAPQVEAAVQEFPDLAYYRDTDRPADAIRLAGALRGYGEPERTMRLETLRKTIAADQRGALHPAPPRDRRAEQIFDAFNAAAQALNRAGGVEGFRESISSAEGLELALYRGQFADCADLAAALAEACQPTIRRIK